MNSKRSNLWVLLPAFMLEVLGSTVFAESHHVSVKVGSCYTLGSWSSTTENPCPADLFMSAGVNVDVMSASLPNLCLLDGSFDKVEAVPSDYSRCQWDQYLEGMEELSGKGLIIRDRTGQHHFKWRVQSNALPQIIFDQVRID